MRLYQQITGREVSADRVMAWHLRTALGDALWRSEAGLPLADQRTPSDWIDDLAALQRVRHRPRSAARGEPGDDAPCEGRSQRLVTT
jgi:hypothetical protein